MKQRRTRTATTIGLCAALMAGGAVLAADSGPPAQEIAVPASDSGAQSDDDFAASTTCRESFSSGSGASAFNWCYSDDGNIVMLEHSSGLEHVANGTITEGWCIAAGGVKRGETFGASANVGLNPPFYPRPNAVAHRTTDGSLRVEQQFSEQPNPKTIIITMKIRNVGDSTLNNVFLTRFIDADLSNTTGGDVWAASARSVAVYEPGSSRLELIPRFYKFPANSLIYSSFVPSLDQDCYDATADTTDEAAASDRSMGVLYQLGNLFPGQTKNVKFLYRIST